MCGASNPLSESNDSSEPLQCKVVYVTLWIIVLFLYFLFYSNYYREVLYYDSYNLEWLFHVFSEFVIVDNCICMWTICLQMAMN